MSAFLLFLDMPFLFLGMPLTAEAKAQRRKSEKPMNNVKQVYNLCLSSSLTRFLSLYF
jgi:hypothetical protein